MPSSFFLCDKRNEKRFGWKPKKDNNLQVLKATILQGWPQDKSKFPPLMTPYYSGRDELSIYEGLVFSGERLVVPQGLRADIKRELHASNAGVGACLRRARESVYWTSMNSELRHWILACKPSLQFHMAKTLMSHEIGQRLWEKMAVDLFTLDQKDYLVTIGLL